MCNNPTNARQEDPGISQPIRSENQSVPKHSQPISFLESKARSQFSGSSCSNLQDQVRIHTVVCDRTRIPRRYRTASHPTTLFWYRNCRKCFSCENFQKYFRCKKFHAKWTKCCGFTFLIILKNCVCHIRGKELFQDWALTNAIYLSYL